MCITTNVPIELPKLPYPWEYTGEYRKPQKGEKFAAVISATQLEVREANQHTCAFFFIVEAKRWRAEAEEDYWFIRTDLSVVAVAEFHAISDSDRWEAGNYFKTKSEAESYAEKIKSLLLA